MFIVTANLLSTGEPVYWCESAQWTSSPTDATVFAAKDEAVAVTAARLEYEHLVCDPFVAKLENTPDSIRLLGQKLTIRQQGGESMLRSIGLLDRLEPQEGA